jgi:hypothetical protein
VFFIYYIHFLKNVSLNSVVQLIHVEADICAVCFCNKVGNGELFVPEEVGGGTQPVGYEVGNSADYRCCQFHCGLFLTLPQPAVWESLS